MRRERSRRSTLRGATAARIIAILAAVGCCLAAAAYATTTRPFARGPEEKVSRPLRPRIVLHPQTVTTEPTADFDFTAQGRPAGRARPHGPALGFECRLDDGNWDRCAGPLTLRGIARGFHVFSVRAVNRAGGESPASTFRWRRTREATPPTAPEPTPTSGGAPIGIAPAAPVGPPAEPSEPPVEPPVTGLPFTIEQIGSLGDLYPGAPAEPISVQIHNPNPSAISVVSLTATIATDPPGCPAVENFVLTPAAIDTGAPFVVPAEATVALPIGIAPTIAMVNLPTSQDACQAAELEIALSGEASG